MLHCTLTPRFKVETLQNDVQSDLMQDQTTKLHFNSFVRTLPIYFHIARKGYLKKKHCNL